MHHQTLDVEAWHLSAVGDLAHVPADLRDRAIRAVVPGCVHTDLLRAGLIADPDHGDGETAGAWIGRTDWRYRCVFDADDALFDRERIDLVCHGLDTAAMVVLNGRDVGLALNMHHPHRFDARDALRRGRNELSITFAAPLPWAEREEQRLGSRPVNGDWGPYAFMRKMACSFGWDWGPQAPTSGIWRSIGLEGWSGARLMSVRPLVVQADALRAVVDVHVALEHAVEDEAGSRATRIRCTLDDAGRRVEGETYASGGAADACVRLSIDRPRLWWPRGFGAPHLCDLRVGMTLDGRVGNARSGRIEDTWSGRIGLRTVRLDTSADANGAAFTLDVNGRPIFCRGANWIPASLFPPRPDASAYRHLIGEAVHANMNMLRVWGGGRYEDDVFYETCDAEGLLVWQDFCFACATYPEEDPYPALVEAEARHQVARLSRHPSVVLWCGGNENIVAYESWGWKERLRPGQTWGRRYFHELLPALVTELDPTRPYWPDSPWSGASDFHPQDPDRGDRHTWDARIEGYRDLVPRFVSEFGHQGPPNMATLRAALPGEDLVIGSAALRHRQRAGGGDAKQYDEPLARWFLPARDFDEWHHLAQVLQARAIALGIEWHRANMPRCMGSLFWQLNDVWTGHSWSAIDVAGRRKPLWYAVRRAFAPRILTIHPVNGGATLFAVNDTDTAWETDLLTRRLDFDGGVLSSDVRALDVPPRTSAVVHALEGTVGAFGAPARELAVADADGARGIWFARKDRHLDLPAPRLAATVARDGDDIVVDIRAESLVRDLVIAADRVDGDAVPDENMVTMLPGERRTVRVRTAIEVEPRVWTRPPVLRAVGSI